MNTPFIKLSIGPMFSGKSAWLIEQLKDNKEKHQEILAINFHQDTRYSASHIASHDGKTFPSIQAEHSSDITTIIKDYPSLQILGIDEIQFFDIHLSEVLANLREQNISVYASGLDYDYKGNIWETTAKVRTISDETTQLYAVCSVCHKHTATRTQRINMSHDRIVIGGADIYEPRCELHFEKPE